MRPSKHAGVTVSIEELAAPGGAAPHQTPCARSASRACAAQSRLARGLAGLGWRMPAARTDISGTAPRTARILAVAKATTPTSHRKNVGQRFVAREAGD